MKRFFFDSMDTWAPYQRVLETAKAGRIAAAYGMTEVQKAHLAAAIACDTGRPVLLIAPTEQQASRLHDDVVRLLDGGAALLPARELSLYHAAAASREIAFRRIEALHAVLAGDTRILVCAADTLMHRLCPKAAFVQNTHELAVGGRVHMQALVSALVRAGYERVERVEAKGQLAVRGGIIDVFAPHLLHAVRIEFFDDEIDSLRTFDVLTQRSVETLRHVWLPPASEVLLSDEEAQQAGVRLAQALARLMAARGHLTGSLHAPRTHGDALETLPSLDTMTPLAHMQARPGSTEAHLAQWIGRCEAALAENGRFTNMEALMVPLYERSETLLDWFDAPLLLLDEPDHLRERCENRHLEFQEAYRNAFERGEALPEQAELLVRAEELFPRIAEHGVVTFSAFLRTMAMLRPKVVEELRGMGAADYQGRLPELAADLRRWKEEGWRIALLAGGTSRGKRLQQSLDDLHVSSTFEEAVPEALTPGVCTVLPISLSHGFLYPELRLAVVADGDLYGASIRKAHARRNVGERIAAFTDLAVGDYVVHESHGVGVYQGTVRLQSEGKSRDYLFIQYQGNDKLYVPTDQMDRVQRYIGAENAAPRLNRLGGNEWNRQKQKVKASIREIAFDLVRLYAERRAHKGYAFASDSPWMRQFEDNFPYEETPDQLQAIAEIKADMEAPTVMDRLLCGDVGYGKTEVALRAAFKAVLDSKQVAILAPTTILAQQHYATIVSRFEGFPVRAEVISRFKTAAEQRAVIQRVKAGEVDILVGTHRLLGKDVKFKDLGLLVVDEEQRFGVQHKETIKNMRTSVDVLTLSATPIPRTLHMSMVGIRDMSLLETPPDERYPVQTYVLEYADGIVRDAILREMQRQGQVYFLYNRVGSIEQFHARISRLVPEARIAIGHGQMREHMLEDVMMDFYEGKYDVLLCTTIIESGLDIPRANTLIVYDADHFGLSQLYQLRGRVGRSNRLAYAYLTVRPQKALGETADKRLRAIREFTQFGSGFRIAMRDLEIRGAGNLLGAEQHGFLSTVGYDMYCKLMEETVREIRGEMGEPEAVETRVELKVDAYLPADYIAADAQRIEVYKRIAAIEDTAAREDLEEELVDRFGDIPEEVARLMDIALLKALCKRLCVDLVSQRGDQLQFRFAPNASLPLLELMAALRDTDRRLMFSAATPPSVILRDARLSREALLHTAIPLLQGVVVRTFPA